MPLAFKTGVVKKDGGPVHARRPGLNVAVCNSGLTLGDVSNALFEPDHPLSCRLCLFETSKLSDQSYYDWLDAKLPTEEAKRAFNAAFNALVSGEGGCAEDTAFIAAENFAKLQLQHRREAEEAKRRHARLSSRRRVEVALSFIDGSGVCMLCGETFCPANTRDLEHAVKEDGSECGGRGELRGSWR